MTGYPFITVNYPHIPTAVWSDEEIAKIAKAGGSARAGAAHGAVAVVGQPGPAQVERRDGARHHRST